MRKVAEAKLLLNPHSPAKDEERHSRDDKWQFVHLSVAADRKKELESCMYIFFVRQQLKFDLDTIFNAVEASWRSAPVFLKESLVVHWGKRSCPTVQMHKLFKLFKIYRRAHFLAVDADQNSACDAVK